MGWCTVVNFKKMKYAKSILRLMHAKSSRVAVELNSEVLINWTEIVGFKGAVKVSFELGNKMKIATCDKNVINTNEESNGIISHMGKIDVRIRLRLNKLPSKKCGMKTCLPSARALAQSIQGFVKLTHEV